MRANAPVVPITRMEQAQVYTKSIVVSLAAGCAALLLSACATPEAKSPGGPYAAPATRTGSNIPVAREQPTGSRSPSTSEQQRIDETVLPRPTRGGGGGG